MYLYQIGDVNGYEPCFELQHSSMFSKDVMLNMIAQANVDVIRNCGEDGKIEKDISLHHDDRDIIELLIKNYGFKKIEYTESIDLHETKVTTADVVLKKVKEIFKKENKKE